MLSFLDTTGLNSLNFLGHSDLVQLFLYSGFNPEQKDKMGQVRNDALIHTDFNICILYGRLKPG